LDDIVVPETHNQPVRGFAAQLRKVDDIVIPETRNQLVGGFAAQLRKVAELNASISPIASLPRAVITKEEEAGEST
jgi:chemotaxis protein CheY-P-specific phosphatase CheC